MSSAIQLDQRRIILLLRYVVIASAAYLVLADGARIQDAELWYVALFAASNVALAAAPEWLFRVPQFGPILIITDTALILFGLSWGPGLSQDLLLVYFFIIFLTTIGDSLASVAIGSAMVTLVYGSWLWSTDAGLFRSAEAWLRLPFFFLIAIFYAALTEQLKTETRRREVAEHESRHLRLLLDLASAFNETHATRELINSLGRFVEEVAPGLECEVVSRGRAVEGQEVLIPLRAHGEDYGSLAVRTTSGRRLSERERWLCQMVAHGAAIALYSAEQSSAARSAADVKDQFLATISHELRTPLHAIMGFIEILEPVIPEADEVGRDSLQRLRVNACRMQDLVEQVLGFAEIRAGYRSVRTETVDVRTLVTELAPLTRELLKGKPVNFLWEVDAAAETMHTDARKLRQILVCLLSNAAKFTESGEVRLEIGRQGDTVEIQVADTGIGIAPSDLAVVFEDFRQADGSMTRRYGGLGLGLPFTREIASLLGGSMQLQSQPGEGTTVRVLLPVHAGDRTTLDAALVGGGNTRVHKLEGTRAS